MIFRRATQDVTINQTKERRNCGKREISDSPVELFLSPPRDNEMIILICVAVLQNTVASLLIIIAIYRSSLFVNYKIFYAVPHFALSSIQPPTWNSSSSRLVHRIIIAIVIHGNIVCTRFYPPNKKSSRGISS